MFSTKKDIETFSGLIIRCLVNGRALARLVDSIQHSCEPP